MGLKVDLATGLVGRYAPKALRGIMKEYLGRVSFQEMVDWVQKDKSLWAEIPPGYHATLNRLGPKLGEMEWFTVEWIIEVGRETSPSLASLFVGWPEGQEWLERNIQEIKNKLKSFNGNRN